MFILNKFGFLVTLFVQIQRRKIQNDDLIQNSYSLGRHERILIDRHGFGKKERKKKRKKERKERKGEGNLD